MTKPKNKPSYKEFTLVLGKTNKIKIDDGEWIEIKTKKRMLIGNKK